MRHLLLMMGITAMVGLAVPAPAYADGDSEFLAALSGAGLSHRGPDQAAISAGRAVCQLMDGGLTPMDTIVAVQSTNPGFTLERAARFTAISVSSYCPGHM